MYVFVGIYIYVCIYICICVYVYKIAYVYKREISVCICVAQPQKNEHKV